MSADGWIRGSATTVVAGVAGTAGWVSYGHALDVVRLAGESGTAAYVYPVFVDGLVYMSSMVLLAAARRKQSAPALAWWSLGAGIALTLAANIYSMASNGVLGALVGALPAVALVLSYELLMWIVRGTRRTAERTRSGAPSTRETDTGKAAQGHLMPVSSNGHDHVATAYARQGKVPTIRQVKAEQNVGQDRAQEIRQRVAALLP